MMEMHCDLLCYLDPGVTTGFALLTGSGGFAAGQVKGTPEFGRWLEDVFRRGHGTSMVIGWEAYRVMGARSWESTVGLRVMGVAEYLADLHGVQVLREVASEMRKPATPAALKRLGWYRAGQPHAVDASRHMLAHLMRTGIAPDIVRRAFTDLPDGAGSE